jgi:hypothetical protein
MLAAEAAFGPLTEAGRQGPITLSDYETRLKASWVWSELYKIRNFRPSFERWGLYGGVLWSGIDTLLLRGAAPFTFKHQTPDHLALKPASEWYAAPPPNRGLARRQRAQRPDTHGRSLSFSVLVQQTDCLSETRRQDFVRAAGQSGAVRHQPRT